MKKIFTMIIALALVPAFAAAQTTIARVVEQFKKGAVEEIAGSPEFKNMLDLIKKNRPQQGE